MGYVIYNSNGRFEDVNHDSVDEIILQLISEKKTCLIIEKSPDENLSVVITSKGCCAIHTSQKPKYVALDASTEPVGSKERVTLMVDSDPTPIPANMKLGKRLVKSIIKEYCETGGLSKSVYWLPEGPAENLQTGSGLPDKSAPGAGGN